MKVSEYIRGQVESFKDSRSRRKVESLARETASLNRERSRQTEVSYYQAKRDDVAKQVEDITPQKNEGSLMRFGNNLARVINEQKRNPSLRTSKDIKPSVNKKAMNSAFQNTSIFKGSSGISLGGVKETDERYKPKNKSPFV